MEQHERRAATAAVRVPEAHTREIRISRKPRARILCNGCHNHEQRSRVQAQEPMQPVKTNIIRWVPFIRLLPRLQLLGAGPRLTLTGISNGYLKNRLARPPTFFEQTVSNTVALCQLDSGSNRNARLAPVLERKI